MGKRKILGILLLNKRGNRRFLSAKYMFTKHDIQAESN